MVRVKICGLVDPDDLMFALGEGADAVGFVLEPSSPRYVGDLQYEILMGLCGPFVTSVAVFGHANRQVACADAMQAITFGAFASPGQRLIQSVRLGHDASELDKDGLATGIVAVHLDAYSERAFGGTGRTIDWGIAAKLSNDFAIKGLPTVLSGGLTPDNVAEAIRIVQPYAVDVSSGVEASPRKKDPKKVRDFIQAAKSA